MPYEPQFGKIVVGRGVTDDLQDLWRFFGERADAWRRYLEGEPTDDPLGGFITATVLRAASLLGNLLVNSLRVLLDDEYGGDVAALAKDWKWARLLMPLQVRLAMEQGWWELGIHKHLITGFEPIKTSPSGNARRKSGKR